MGYKKLKLCVALFLIFFNQFIFAENIKENEAIFFLKNKYSEGKYYVGRSSQLYIYSDLIRDGDSKYAAIVRMDDIDGTHPSIVLVNVYLFQGACEGSPNAYFHYSGKSVNEKIMPQIFSVSDNACIEIEFYGLDEGVKKKLKSKLKLVDKFKVKIKTGIRDKGEESKSNDLGVE
jgi:hypothetical protein